MSAPTDIVSLGEDWIGHTPPHWSVKKLGFLFDLISSGTTPATESRDFYDGDVPWITTSELRETLIVDANVKLTRAAIEAHSALRIYDVGTVLIAMYGATIGRLGILGIEAATNQACCALARPRGAHPKFVYYALLAGRVVLIEQASGGGQPNINQEKIRAFKIPVPPVHEQRAIVDFIERETAKIDALLDRQATFRAKLQEHRDALLSHLLEQDYPSVRLRFIAALNPSKGEISHLDPALEVSFVPMEAVGEDSSLDSSRLKPISEVSTGYTYFRDGDILIAKITPCFENGKATLARGLTGGVGFGSTEFHVVRPRECFDPRYAFYLLWSSAFRDIATASMYGAGGQKRVPTDFLADFPIPLPPLAEQRAIADRLDDQTAKIDGLIAKQDDFIERLRERRAALITAAVTGQIAIAANIAAEAAA